MNVQQAYNQWSEQYDTNTNRTRDLEAVALQTVLTGVATQNILEIGCGIGKNSAYLLTKAETLLAIDLSEAMLAKATEKIASPKAAFLQADITQEWNFTSDKFSLITFSLVLEHIENLDFIFAQAVQKLLPGGCVYVGELHPFKQYTGTKARFDTEGGRTEVECYTHNISDFVQAAIKQGLQLMDLQEFFDDNDAKSIPRVLALLFKLL